MSRSKRPAKGLPDEVLHCRVFGHFWDYDLADIWEPKREYLSGDRVSIECKNGCGKRRREVWARHSGGVIWRGYRSPSNYSFRLPADMAQKFTTREVMRMELAARLRERQQQDKVVSIRRRAS